MSTANNYAYLWDGTQPDWVLLRINRQVVSVTITFGDAPTLKDVASVRAAIPAYAAMRPSEAFAALKGKYRLALGDFEAREGRRIEQDCKRHGLVVETAASDATTYLPFNEKSRRALLIEDHELAQAVCRSALAHGIRIGQVET
jgi:hypothetical protein